jgi:Na+-driven multidrug efflux pump
MKTEADNPTLGLLICKDMDKVEQLYQVTDAIIVGQGAGVEALASVSVADWSYWLAQWAISAMTQGFAIPIAQYFGDRDVQKVRKAVAMSVWLTLSASAVLIGMDLMYPLIVSNVNCGMNLHYPWRMYVIVYVAVLVLYFVMNGLLTSKIKKVNLAEVLKNRE